MSEAKIIENKIVEDKKEPLIAKYAVGDEKVAKRMEELVKEIVDNKKNEWKLHTESRNMTIDQKQEMMIDMFNYLQDRFGEPFMDITLTKDSNFNSNSHLLKCHKFLQSIEFENVNWNKSHFRYNPYGDFSAVVYLGENDYIEFLSIGDKFTTFRFSFDVVGNIYTMKFPYPAIRPSDYKLNKVGEKKEEKDEKVNT